MINLFMWFKPQRCEQSTVILPQERASLAPRLPCCSTAVSLSKRLVPQSLLWRRQVLVPAIG